MLLKHLYDFALSRHLLDDLAFSSKAVRWIIELDRNGNLVGAGPQATGDDKRGKEFSCPQTTRPKVAGGVSEFLADGLTAVFGLDPDPEEKMKERKRADRDANNIAKRTDFWAQINDAYEYQPSPELIALIAFGSRLKTQLPTFLRWGKDQKPDAKSDKPAWWLTTASGTELRLGAENFTFRVDQSLLLEDEPLRQFWRDRHGNEVAAARASFVSGRCLITGRENEKLAPTHNPKIQGVPNTKSFGASVVSFESAAFSSYGFDKSLNSPTSYNAATAYCVGLNHLISSSDHAVRIGQTTLCFWAAETAIAQTPFSFLNKPDTKLVRDFVRAPFGGIQREIARRERFFAVTLAGNSGRIVIRHWMDVSLEQAVENLHQWFIDLDIAVPTQPPKKLNKASTKENDFHPLSIYWLARATVRDAKALSSEITAQLYRAALEGAAPSISLLRPLINQLHSRLVRDDTYNLLTDESRFALIKLIINRNRSSSSMAIEPNLIADTNDAAYNCGRLLSILNETQKKAHEYGLKGATIVEKFFGTASTSPSYVFPYLIKLNRHHLQKIRKSAKYSGDERFLEEAICNILSRLGQTEAMFMVKSPPSFPRTLDLQAQGRFALGFYQQTASDVIARQTSKKATATPVRIDIAAN